jgi:hypothetical protein
MPLDPARLWKLDVAAQVAGVTVDLLASAITNADLPGVTIVTLGPKRVRYVRAEPFIAWLDGLSQAPSPAPTVDACADLLKD